MVSGSTIRGKDFGFYCLEGRSRDIMSRSCRGDEQRLGECRGCSFSGKAVLRRG